VGSLISWGVQARLLGRRIAADQAITASRFEFDKQLIERKFEQEKAQLIHRRRFELAEGLLADAYRFRRLVAYARTNVSFEGEGETRKPAEVEAENVVRTKNRYFVPIERLQRDGEFLSAFMAREYSAEAHFGPDVTKVFGLFRDSVARVQAASTLLIDTVGMPNNSPALIKDARGDLWANYATVNNKADEVARMIEDGVVLVESFCRPVLEWTGG
jgi:hypothetical protein